MPAAAAMPLDMAVPGLRAGMHVICCCSDCQLAAHLHGAPIVVRANTVEARQSARAP
jgi:hypothetical protein